MLIQSDKNIKDNFGYIADASLSKWTNAKFILGNMSQQQYYNRIKNMAYHNLCTYTSPPANIGSLLGLGLKFCIQSRRPFKDSIREGMDRMRRDVRLKYLFAGSEESTEYNPKLYIKSDWEPPIADLDIENRIDDFEQKLTQLRLAKNSFTTPSTNLTPTQEKLLYIIQKDKSLVVLQTDKNLGAALMEWNEYVHCMLEQHLLKGDTYDLISEETAHKKLYEFRRELQEILTFDGERELTDSEKIYFTRGFKAHSRIPQLYGNPKVHKNWINHVPMRPVNSQVGSLSATASKYVDYYLQMLVRLVPSYVNRSQQVVNNLIALGILPPTTSLSTSNATAMYTYIDLIEGVDTIEKYFKKFGKECKRYIPFDLLIKLLRLIMTSNVFKFGIT